MYKSFIVWSVLAYGALVLLFGLLGYMRAGSMASLISGVSFGTLLGISALFLACKKKLGGILAFFASFVLTIIFSIRYAMTGKMIPGAFALFSAAILLFFMIQLFLRGIFSQGEGSPKEK